MIPLNYFVVFLLANSLYVSLVRAVGLKDVILEPPQHSSGEEVCLIFMQGADISPLQYVPLLKFVQQEISSSYRLWVGIPDYFKNSVNPLDIDRGIERIKSSLQGKGMNASKFFYGGHSLGGAMIQMWTMKHPQEMLGQILLGSFLTREWKNDYIFSYPVPTLSVGGELDGLARVTRFAEAFYTQLMDVRSPNLSDFKSFPVTVIKGSTHMQFASGDPPKLVYERDLMPEISNQEAHLRISYDIINFMKVRLNGDSVAADNLNQRVIASQEFLLPIIDALLLEGYHNFLPPCLCGTDICQPQTNCTAACPYTNSVSQPTMGGGLDAALIIADIDSFHDVWETKPEVHLPTIMNSCTNPEGCTLSMQSVTQGVYHTGEDLEIWKLHFDVAIADSGFAPVSAIELRTKMNSRQNIYSTAGVPNVDFDETDGQHNRCGEINLRSIDYASTHAAVDTLNRFSKYGQAFVVQPDLDVCSAGPCWIWKELQFTPSSDGSIIEVASPQFVTPTDFWLKASAGFHYCKILSPARVVEWMYVDGLRAKYSLASHEFA